MIQKAKEVFLLTATSSTETAKSESPENDNYTAFTHELLVILEQGIESAGEILTLQDIFNCLKKRLKGKKLPKPEISSHGSSDELGICQNQANLLSSVMPNQNAIQTPTPDEENTSVPTLMSPILLNNRIRQLPRPLFNDICFYLKEKYHYDLNFIDVNGVPADAARQLIELLKQFPQGLNHLQQLLEERRLL